MRGGVFDTSPPNASPASYMADVYEHTRAWIFVAGRPERAEEIARRAFRPVFCHDLHRMIFPGETIAGGFSAHTPLRWLWRLGMAARTSASAMGRSIAPRTRGGSAVR
jgi:hypothetical protein